jgi:hypothetical protein
MRTTTILADTRREGTCRYCGQSVEYAQTPAGKGVSFHPPIYCLPQQINLLTGDAPRQAYVVSPRHLDRCTVWQRRKRRKR